MTKPLASDPAHVVADGDAKRTLCGLKVWDGQKGLAPIVGARFVQQHIDGHGLVVCPTCLSCVPSAPPEGQLQMFDEEDDEQPPVVTIDPNEAFL